jgi:hypothetical protein
LLQEFAEAIKQLAHWSLVILPKAPFAFFDGVKGLNMKQHLLMGDGRSHNGALNQALKLDVMKMAVRPPVKLWEVRAGAPTRSQSAATECCRTGQPVCLHCGDMKHLRADCL